MSDINTNAATAEVIVLTRSQKIAAQIETINKRIEADTTKVASLKLELETVAKLEGVGVDTQVRVKLGRAETTREVEAVVVGVKTDEENGSRRFKVLYGTGLDTDTVIVQESQIVEVLAA